MVVSGVRAFLSALVIIFNIRHICVDSFSDFYQPLQLVSLNTTALENENRTTSSVAADFLNFGVKKQQVLQQQSYSNILKSKVEILSKLLKIHVDHLRDQTDKVELVFLVDASASVGVENFRSELNFVRKLLSDFTVAPAATRVAVVTFSGKTSIIRHVDQISNAEENNHKCRLLNQQLKNITYSGGGTYTRGALLEALDILERSRSGAKKAVFLVTDGFSNGGDPRPIATLLKKAGAIIFTFGIRTGNIEELHDIASEPGYTYSYLLDSFPEFEALARRALHHDLKSGDYVTVSSAEDCNFLCSGNATNYNKTQCCDTKAACACGIVTGHYTCLCDPGYFGTGLFGFCQACPNGTFGPGNIPGDSSAACTACPDPNHVTLTIPATSSEDCVCATGFTTRGNKCDAIICPKLMVPENGYLVKANACNNVVNAACGVRCKIGFHLTGDSIRLCLTTGLWSGTEPECLLKTCPSLQVPPHGRIRCKHEDDRQIISVGLSAYPIDTHCDFKCDIGYHLRGSRSRNCLPLSRWDGLQTSCRAINCQPLRSVPNGVITPEHCTGIEKLYFGTNCTIRCKKGFTLKGPGNRVCAGRTGSWSNRHNVTQCVDTTPPTITCPSNITVETLPGKNYSFVNWTDPVATDNAEAMPTIWSEQFVEFPWTAGIGVHVIVYRAQDASKNQAECNFSVTVLDKESPTVENCVDPLIFLLENEIGATNITWEEPVFYDNSGLPIDISSSHVPGQEIFKLGTTRVVYNATDKFNNTRSCVLNITVEDACENLPSSLNGRSDCASLNEGVQCVVTCEEGYALVLQQQVSYPNSENITLTCNRENHSWNNDVVPDCSLIQVPYAVEQNLTVVVDANTSHCEDPTTLKNLGVGIKTGLESQVSELCGNGIDCNVTQSEFVCGDEIDGKLNLANSEKKTLKDKSKRNVSPHLDSHEFRNRKKRSSPRAGKKNGQKWDKIEMKFKIIGKILEINSNNSKRGMVKLREKLETMTKNGQLNFLDNKTNQEIGRLALHLDLIFDEPGELCHVGSVLKKHNCVKCPLGTFHNTTRNQCQSCPFGEYQDESGSKDCKKCPGQSSTRKMHSRNQTDCIAICRPGFYSRRKRHHKSTLALEPCVTCQIGFYQPAYAQSKCIECPKNTTTVQRGANEIDQCIPLDKIDKNPCDEKPCKNEGVCVRIDNNFSCKCIGDFIGSACEILPNPCDSSPCLNEGQCIASNTSDNRLERKCLCKNGFTGVNCETYIDECLNNPCQNNGTCTSTEEDFKCLCKDGFEGEFCEIPVNHCEVSPCEAGSTCSNVNGTWKCSCKAGFLGRRCSRLPCDWLPCHTNAICVNIEEVNATKKSYRCECPEGFTGENCTERIDHCENSPCLNNGRCLNNPSNFTCLCQKEFNGSKCENELSSAYTMRFPKSGTTDYVMINGPGKSLSEFTICLWLQSVDTFNYGTVLSYATDLQDNALTLTDYNGFVIYVNGNRVVTDITANDGFWHFLCVTWENVFGSWKVFVDGEARDNGTSLATGVEIQGNGTLVIGQEQDRLGGGFSESESLLGKLSLLDIWDEVLDGEVIKKLSIQCETYHGSLYSWAQLQGYIRGNIEVQKSSFCQSCPLPVVPFKGDVKANEDASEIVYTCEKGYLVKFGKNESSSLKRRCLKQGQWEGYFDPTCTRVKCGFPGYFSRGQVHGKSYSYGDKVRYTCTTGSELRGNRHRTCTADGTWSGIQPVCIGKTCKNLLAPENGDIEYFIEENERDDLSILQVGQQLEFKCNPGFRVLGEAVLTCLENGEWDNVAPTCIAFGCPPPEAIKNGYIASNISTGVETLLQTFADSQASGSFDGEASSESGYFYGDIVGFSCHEGYKFQGNRNMIAEFRVQCTNNGSWNGVIPNCVPLHCQRPETVQNGKLYLLSGNNTLTEIPRSEKFNNLTFIKKLVPISAEHLPNFDGPFDIPISTDELNTSESVKEPIKRNVGPQEFQAEFSVSFVLGAQISVVCNKGYKVSGAFVRNCTSNETWSSTSPICKPVECDQQHHPLMKILSENKENIKYENEILDALESEELIKIFRENNYLRGILHQFAFVNNGSVFGDIITLTCLNNTKINFKDIGIEKVVKNITWTCDENGAWNLVDKEISSENLQSLFDEKKEEFCQETVCSSVKVPVNGYIVNGGSKISPKKVGDGITFKCRHGYFIKGNESIECLADGTWSAPPTCESVACAKPPSTPLNAVLDDSSGEASSYVFGNMVSYRCLPGYKMYGIGNARCLANGKWSRMNGRCFRISCGKPKAPFGVKTLGPSYLYQDHLAYICPDKIQRGKITCKVDGNWSEFPDCSVNSKK